MHQHLNTAAATAAARADELAALVDADEPQPRFTVGCQAPSDQARPWIVRDNYDSTVVVRVATVTDASDWAEVLNAFYAVMSDA